MSLKLALKNHLFCDKLPEKIINLEIKNSKINFKNLPPSIKYLNIDCLSYDKMKQSDSKFPPS